MARKKKKKTRKRKAKVSPLEKFPKHLKLPRWFHELVNERRTSGIVERGFAKQLIIDLTDSNEDYEEAALAAKESA